MKRLLRALGVTRVARLTGLDRCGVEVATAVRPRGHVLQVTQGKGLTFEGAVASALGEAAELAAAENVTGERLQFHDGRAWAEAEVFGQTRKLCELVPADAVWCAGFGSTWLGPVSSDWSTNGLASHPSRAAAVEHAVLELVERDAVARALPRGWSAHAAKAMVQLELPLIEQIESQGFEVFAFDLTVAKDTAAFVAGVLLFDLEAHVVPLTAGYAARRSLADAITAALLEAAQSRLTEIHGAREDVSIGDRVDGAALHLHLKARETMQKQIKAAKPRKAPLTNHKVLIVELAREPLYVVKALSPSLRHSELL